MFAIYLKEIRSFFSSIIAYVVITVFLVANGIFFWIIPNYSVLENGSADLNTLFDMAPWIFMFLVPAVTMRSFAEERKSGTYEILMTKPVSDIRIILAKYLANLTPGCFLPSSYINILYLCLPPCLSYRECRCRWNLWLLPGPVFPRRRLRGYRNLCFTAGR